MTQKPSLGCGLVAIGRSWGTTPQIPSESQAIAFLENAFEMGIRFFDTAPAYGLSEERLGIFLDNLPTTMLNETFIATKVGEHWDEQKNEAYVNHSYEAMQKSLDVSHQKLKKIDLLQLHKTNKELLSSPEVSNLFTYAQKQHNINTFGASISDEETLSFATDDIRLTYLQFPYNVTRNEFGKYIPLANAAGKHVIINRPLQMGEITQGKIGSIDQAFEFILREPFEGIILTGTSNPEHLRINRTSFERCRREGR